MVTAAGTADALERLSVASSSHGKVCRGRRMLRTLRACRLPPTVSPHAPPLLAVAQDPLMLAFLPTMLFGPTGCGKSTLLAELARRCVSAAIPAPTVLVRLRLPSSTPGRQGAGSPAFAARVIMDSAATQFYAQIGYPSRLSLLTSLCRGFSLGSGCSDARLDLAAAAMPESGIRLVAAL